MSLRTRLMVTFAVLVLSACATPQQKMSGPMSCPSGEVRIMETNPGLGTDHTTWRAACGDKQYICNSGPYMGKADWLNDMSCTPTTALGPTESKDYLSRDGLEQEKSQSFGDFLRSLTEPAGPETSTQ